MTDSSSHAGHLYRWLSNKERHFSTLLDLGKKFLSTLMAVCFLFAKSLRQFFEQKYKRDRLPIDSFKENLPPSTSDESRIDYTLLLPVEMKLKVFSYLTSTDLGRVMCVNTEWEELANDEVLWKNLPLPTIALGKKAWATYVGDIGKEPPLSSWIHKFLKKPCRIWPGKKIEDTHFLILIPEFIDGELLNLINLKKFFKSVKKGNALESFFYTDIVNRHGKIPPQKAHWVLMAKNVIPDSIGRYADKKTLITRLSEKTKIPYEIPNLFDAALCIFMNYVTSNELLFLNSMTYTCDQSVIGGDLTNVGCIAPNTLCIDTIDSDAHIYTGFAPLMNLSASF